MKLTCSAVQYNKGGPRENNGRDLSDRDTWGLSISISLFLETSPCTACRSRSCTSGYLNVQIQINSAFTVDMYTYIRMVQNSLTMSILLI